MRKAVCDASFKKHSQGNEGVLKECDTMNFCVEVSSKLGVAVDHSKLEAAVKAVHKKNTGGLCLNNFSQFFERFLRQLSTQLPESCSPADAQETVDTPSPTLTRVLEDFRGLVDASEWRSQIEITLEDSAVLQRRI